MNHISAVNFNTTRIVLCTYRSKNYSVQTSIEFGNQLVFDLENPLSRELLTLLFTGAKKTKAIKERLSFGTLLEENNFIII